MLNLFYCRKSSTILSSVFCLLFFCTRTQPCRFRDWAVCVHLTSTDLGFLPSFRAPIANSELAYWTLPFYKIVQIRTGWLQVQGGILKTHKYSPPHNMSAPLPPSVEQPWISANSCHIKYLMFIPPLPAIYFANSVCDINICHLPWVCSLNLIIAYSLFRSCGWDTWAVFTRWSLKLKFLV